MTGRTDMKHRTDIEPSATATLERTHELVLPQLRAVVARLDSGVGAMAEYHFGWSTMDGTPATGETGKLIRPALTLLAAEAVGAPAPSAVPGAVAVELVHNFSLIHDDIMDHDDLRRGRPALWRCFGAGSAILVGDALHALAFEVLCEHENPRAARALSVALRDLVCGQARDMEFSSRPWHGPDAVGVDEYRTMATQKTGALMSAALAVGAELGGGPPDTVAAFAEMGKHLGLAFQCVDDILGIWGDAGSIGKPALGDLREGKRTLPLLGALAGRDGREIAALLDDAERTEPDLYRAAVLIERSGGRVLAQQEVVRQTGLATALLARVPVPVEIRAEFTALCEALVGRTR